MPTLYKDILYVLSSAVIGVLIYLAWYKFLNGVPKFISYLSTTIGACVIMILLAASRNAPITEMAREVGWFVVGFTIGWFITHPFVRKQHVIKVLRDKGPLGFGDLSAALGMGYQISNPWLQKTLDSLKKRKKIEETGFQWSAV